MIHAVRDGNDDVYELTPLGVIGEAAYTDLCDYARLVARQHGQSGTPAVLLHEDVGQFAFVVNQECGLPEGGRPDSDGMTLSREAADALGELLACLALVEAVRGSGAPNGALCGPLNLAFRISAELSGAIDQQGDE